MTLRRVAAVAAFLILAGSAPALASVDLAGVFGLSGADQQSTSTLASVETTQKDFLSYGVWGSYDFGDSLYSLSAGLLYTEMGSHTATSAVGVSQDYDFKLPYLQLPVFADYWVISYVALGFGGYFSLAAGDASQSGSQTVGAVGSAYGASGSFNSLGLSGDDYGLAFHAQIRIPVGGDTFVLVNGLYLLGLENIDDSGQGTIRNESFIIQGGFGLNI